MKQITKSVIKLSDIPQHLQKDEILKGHKVHTYAEFHIDDSEQDELTLWLLSQYPTLKRKTSFLIHIDTTRTMKTAVEWLHSEYKRILGSVLVTPQQVIEMSDALENAKEIEKGQRQEDTNSGYSQGWDDGNQNKEPMRPELKQQDNEDSN